MTELGRNGEVVSLSHRIAILYVCTGRYKVFWKDFYESSQDHFFRTSQKSYFVFSDAGKDDFAGCHDLRITYQTRLGWPFDTLMRFDFFRRKETELEDFDYIFFINANMVFLKDVSDDILPTDDESGLVLVQHPGYFHIENPDVLPYERNAKSSAYVPFGSGKYYFMGGFNGGMSKAYIQMIRELDDAVKKDLSVGLIAKWHDESHLNRYAIGKAVRVCDPSLGFPEGSNLPVEPRVLIRDKQKWGGHDYLRRRTWIRVGSFSDRFFKFIVGSRLNRGAKKLMKLAKLCLSSLKQRPHA